MKLKIFDYNNRPKEVDIGDIENIDVVVMRILSGDEVLYVIHKDGSEAVFDSSDDRIHDFDDGIYLLYSDSGATKTLLDEKFLNRNRNWDEVRYEEYKKGGAE